MRILRSFIYVLVWVPLAFSCTYDEAPVCNEPISNVSFSTEVTRVIEQNCSNQSFGNCHGSGASIGDYTGFAGVKGKADAGSLLSRVVNQRDMPPAYSEGPTSMAPCDVEIIRIWLAEGAQDN